MALSSWSALYTHIERKFMLKRRYKLFFLLRAICHHTDAFGMAYPGPDKLKELSGFGTDKELNEGLQFLVDGEYIKIWESWNRKRKKWDTDYQVSPWAMYIREEYQSYCEQIWESGERDFGLEEAFVIKRNGQPESETESIPESDNQNHNHLHYPGTIAAKRLIAGSASDYANQSEGQQRKRKASSGKARRTEKENPQAGGSVPPEKIDLRRYQSPLPRPSDEDYAQDLQLMFRMRISQARGLVATYGAELVATSAAAVQDAMSRGAATNPPGLLTHLLKRGGITTDDKQLYTKNGIAEETARLEAYQDEQN